MSGLYPRRKRNYTVGRAVSPLAPPSANYLKGTVTGPGRRR
jgi:hypothetical protein